jgi:hypothetical protein
LVVGKAYEIGLLVARLNGYLAGDESCLEGVEDTPGFREAHTTSFDFGGYVFARHPGEWARRMETLGARRARWYVSSGASGSSDDWGVQVDLASRTLVWRTRDDRSVRGNAVRWTPRLLDSASSGFDANLETAAREWLDICSDLLMTCEAAAFPEFLIRYEAARLLLQHPDPEPPGASVFPKGHYSLKARQLFYSVEIGWAPGSDWWMEWIEDVDSVFEYMTAMTPRILRAQTAALVAAVNSFEPSRSFVGVA